MDNIEKILFLEKLLVQASKKLKSFGYSNNFFLYENINPLFELGTNECMVKNVNENTNATFPLIFSLHGNPILEKSKKIKHSLKSIINRWKNSKSEDDEDILLQIVFQMETEVDAGYSIGIKFDRSFIPGLILWHAKVPIEQLAIELDVAS